MRRLLVLACSAFPREHRARRSGELVDTAFLAASGSVFGTVREVVSLLVAGAGQRLLAERHFSLRDGVEILARVLAVVNLALAVAGTIKAAGSPIVYVIGVPTIGFGRVAPAFSSIRRGLVVDWLHGHGGRHRARPGTR